MTVKLLEITRLFLVCLLGFYSIGCTSPKFSQLTLSNKNNQQKTDTITKDDLPVLDIGINNYSPLKKKINKIFKRYYYEITALHEKDTISFISEILPSSNKMNISYPIIVKDRNTNGNIIVEAALMKKRSFLFFKSEPKKIETQKKILFFVCVKDTSEVNEDIIDEVEKELLQVRNVRPIEKTQKKDHYLRTPKFNTSLSLLLAIQSWSNESTYDIILKIEPDSNVSVLGDRVIKIKEIKANSLVKGKYFTIKLHKNKSNSFFIRILLLKGNNESIFFDKRISLF